LNKTKIQYNISSTTEIHQQTVKLKVKKRKRLSPSAFD